MSAREVLEETKRFENDVQAVELASPALCPGYAAQSATAQAAWIVDCAEGTWSTLIGIVSLVLLLCTGSWTQALQAGENAIAPFLLICATTGLWASHLASLVQFRLYETRPVAIVHTASLLSIFSAAAFKREHTGLLAMTLPALLCAAPAVVRPPSRLY